MREKIKQKIYCYVDETGQDTGSDFFIVVAVVSDKEQNAIRQQLIKIEAQTRVLWKWQKTILSRNKKYLQLILQKGICKKGYYKATVYIDGIDKKNALTLTNTLRGFGIHLKTVRIARDESEPLIRLAGRWAGCIRKTFEGQKEVKIIFDLATKQRYLKQIK